MAWCGCRWEERYSLSFDVEYHWCNSLTYNNLSNKCYLVGLNGLHCFVLHWSWKSHEYKRISFCSFSDVFLVFLNVTLRFNLNEFKYLQKHLSRLFDALKYLQFLVFDAVTSFSTWRNCFFKMTSRANTRIVAEFVSVASG